MIDKRDVIAFFDKRAAAWDAEMIRHEPVIQAILDNAGVGDGARVLDVACGTGVLFPDYLARGASVTGIDISPEMIKLAERKYAGTGVRFICGDIETADVGQDFDAIVVYNAFPHFPDPERLITHLSGLLTEGGVLTVAHGMSIEALNRHHRGRASSVSREMLTAEELSAVFAPYFEVDTAVSDDEKFVVSGTKR